MGLIHEDAKFGWGREWAENQSRKWYLVALIGVMGFNSGLPLALTASTLVAWLKLSGLSLPIIGLFSAVGLALYLNFYGRLYSIISPRLCRHF